MACLPGYAWIGFHSGGRPSNGASAGGPESNPSACVYTALEPFRTVYIQQFHRRKKKHAHTARQRYAELFINMAAERKIK